MTTEILTAPQGTKYVVGGYRVIFSNWLNGQNEQFFATKEDAQNYFAKFAAYGYKGKVETIYFQMGGN
jgi:hypothetical protein